MPRVTPRRCAASTISAENDAQRSEGSGPWTSTTSRPALPAHSSTVGQSIARTPPSAMRTVGRVCCRSSSSLRSIDANLRAVPRASPNAAMVPDPAKPASTQPVKANTMTGGRVELGLGTGWHDGEHAAYGIPFPPVGVRFAHLEEQLAIITGLWSTPVGERFDYTGHHYTITNSPGLPKPVQQPVPLIIGG